MYKVGVQKHQTALHRGRPTDWEHGQENQSPEDRRANLVRKVKELDSRLGATTDRRARREIGLEKHRLEVEISAIRPKRKCPDATRYFIDAAREILPRHTFRSVLNRATEMAGGKEDGVKALAFSPVDEKGAA